MALAAVMDHAVKVHKETTGPVGRKKGKKALVVSLLCVPMLAFCVYSWIARPEFIWGPGAKPIPPARQEANVRFSMFLLAQRIEAYRHSVGNYPLSLGEVGDSLEGVVYTRVDSVYELRAVDNGKPIVYRPDRSIDEFLGSSPLIIQADR